MAAILLLIAAAGMGVLCIMVPAPGSNLLSAVFILLGASALREKHKGTAVILACVFLIMFLLFFIKDNPMIKFAVKHYDDKKQVTGTVSAG